MDTKQSLKTGDRVCTMHVRLGFNSKSTREPLHLVPTPFDIRHGTFAIAAIYSAVSGPGYYVKATDENGETVHGYVYNQDYVTKGETP